MGVHSQDENCKFHDEDNGFSLSTLFALASSGITGVLIKYGLDAAFRSEVGAPFLEIPANMVGCFLMGFFVQASSISRAATGFAGCITSYASWNQAIVAAAYQGKWAFATCSFFIGLELGYMSYKVGVDAADILFEFHPQLRPDVTKYRKETASGTVLGCTLWISVAILAFVDVERRQLWLSCVLAPQGVCIRWLLAKLNPKFQFAVGTWATNLISSVLQTALEILKIVDPTTGYCAEAFQKGCLGSMSSLSMIVAETHSLHGDGQGIAQAYSYIICSMASCLVLAGVVYTSPLAFMKKVDLPVSIINPSL